MTETEQEFILKNSEIWRELESETQYFSKRMNRLRNKLSPSRLTRERVDHYIELYNMAANHLAYCRTFWGETDTAQYLNRLVGSAHSVIYTKTVFSVNSIFAFLGKGFPKLFRKEFWFFLVAALAFIIPGVIAFLYVRTDIRNALAFMTEDQLAGIRPEGQYDTFNGGISTIEGFYIGSNNIVVCLQAFAGGLTLGLYTLYMLINNGIILGALAGVSSVRGCSAFFWSLILPHGVTELFAIMLSGAAGLMLGYALLRPGNISRKNALILAGKKALRFMVIAVLFLIPSAIIESFFTPRDLPYAVKFIFSGAVFLALAAYLCIGIRKKNTIGGALN